MTSVREVNMQDLDTARKILKKNNDSLVFVKDGQIVLETDSPGIQGLLTAIESASEDLKGSAAADRIVGEAAAQLFAYSRVKGVYADTLSRCGKDVLEKHSVGYEYSSLVPHVLNAKKTDLCPFEKIVSGSKNPQEAYERLKRSTTGLRR